MAELHQSRAEPAAPLSLCRRKATRRFLTVRSVLRQVSGYSLLVQAADSGIPVMSSTATVNIDISDVNDNSPVFTPANCTAVIQVREPGLSGPCLDTLSVLSLLLLGMVYYHVLPNINGPSHRAGIKRVCIFYCN